MNQEEAKAKIESIEIVIKEKFEEIKRLTDEKASLLSSVALVNIVYDLEKRVKIRELIDRLDALELAEKQEQSAEKISECSV